jgi:acyl-CoA dehydrogenase
MTVKPPRSPWVDDEVGAVADTAKKFLSTHAMPNVDRWASQHFVDRDFWLAAGGLGLLLTSVPAGYGGGGGTLAHEFAIFSEQSRILDTAWGNAVHSGIVAPYIVAYGTEEQKQRWLPGMARGELIGAIAMTEPEAGSDLRSLSTRAVRDGDCLVLNGSKTFITNGQCADLVIVAAKTAGDSGGSGSGGISLIVVEAGTGGFTRGPILRKVGQHGQDTSELFFHDCRVPVSNILGHAGDGFVMMMNQLPQERLLIALHAAVTIERAVELTLDHARTRRLFGGTLLDKQHVRFELAECTTIARVARIFIDDCIVRHLAGELDPVTAAMAKAWLTEQQWAVVDRCLQFFGGAGYMADHPMARVWADARAQRIYGGANEVMKELVARQL